MHAAHKCKQSTTHKAEYCRLLIGGLFNKKEEVKEGDVHPFDDTLRRLLSKLQIYHTISRPTQTVSLLTLLLPMESNVSSESEAVLLRVSVRIDILGCSPGGNKRECMYTPHDLHLQGLHEDKICLTPATRPLVQMLALQVHCDAHVACTEA